MTTYENVIDASERGVLVDEVVDVATTNAIMSRDKPVDCYYITAKNDLPSRYENLTFDPASTDHILNNTIGVVDVEKCSTIWINQAGIGHKISKKGRH